MNATDEQLRQVRKQVEEASAEFLGTDCDLVYWLLDDRTDNSLDAIEAIMRLKRGMETMRATILHAQAEIAAVRKQVETLRDMLSEEVPDV